MTYFYRVRASLDGKPVSYVETDSACTALAEASRYEIAGFTVKIESVDRLADECHGYDLDGNPLNDRHLLDGVPEGWRSVES